MTDVSRFRLMSWNMGCGGPGRNATCDDVQRQGDELGIDVALLQEAPDPYESTLSTVPSTGGQWRIETWKQSCTRTCLVDLTAEGTGPGVLAEHLTRPLGSAGWKELGVSRFGSLTAADLTLPWGETITVISVYALWENPVPYRDSPIFAEPSMHRILSDISPLLLGRRQPVLIAGDFNWIFGSTAQASGADWQSLNRGVRSISGHSIFGSRVRDLDTTTSTVFTGTSAPTRHRQRSPLTPTTFLPSRPARRTGTTSSTTCTSPRTLWIAQRSSR